MDIILLGCTTLEKTVKVKTRDAKFYLEFGHAGEYICHTHMHKSMLPDGC